MNPSNAIPESEFSIPTYFSVKVLGKYTLMSLGRKPENANPTSRLIPVTRPFFNRDRLRYLADQNEELIYSGIVMLVTPILFIFFGTRDVILFDGKEILLQFLIAGAIGLRCISLFWIARLSWLNKVSLQDSILLAIFLPATALLFTGFTFGEPVKYIEIAANQEITETESIIEVTETSEVVYQSNTPVAVATFPSSTPVYVNPSITRNEEEITRRQALEEAELARIAS
ncbi:MAG: hypothetical protein WCH59_11795 [Chitinophagia bacterium]|jgi:hypothetical protein